MQLSFMWNVPLSGKYNEISWEMNMGRMVASLQYAMPHTVAELVPLKARQNATGMQWLRWPIACVVYILYSKQCDDLSNKILLWLIDGNAVDYLQN